MAKDKKKQEQMGNPMKKQNLAAWADIKRQEPVSKLPIASKNQVINAKEWG